MDKNNFFIRTIKSDTSGEHDQFKISKILISNLLFFGSRELGQVYFQTDFGEMSLTGPSLRVRHVQHIQTPDDLVLISNFTFKSDYHNELAEMLPLIEIPILFEIRGYLSSNVLINRKQFKDLQNCLNNVVESLEEYFTFVP